MVLQTFVFKKEVCFSKSHIWDFKIVVWKTHFRPEVRAFAAGLQDHAAGQSLGVEFWCGVEVGKRFARNKITNGSNRTVSSETLLRGFPVVFGIQVTGKQTEKKGMVYDSC